VAAPLQLVCTAHYPPIPHILITDITAGLHQGWHNIYPSYISDMLELQNIGYCRYFHFFAIFAIFISKYNT